MKHIKIHSFTHLLHLLYCLILALPLCTILVRCLYVQFNKNAFESYYGQTINEVQYRQIDSISVGSNYRWQSNNYTNIFPNLNDSYIKVNGIRNIQSNDTNTANNLSNYQNQIIYLYFINNGTSNSGISFRSENNTQLFPVGIHNKEVSFEFTALDYNNLNSDILSLINLIEYNNYSYLDNAFEYSLSHFVDNSNIGRLNLVNWFTDVFLDSSNATNMLYLNFINWYMNYALLVSCVYILFLVLMWFVSLARRLIYKGMEI